jgi:hypothetical protein
MADDNKNIEVESPEQNAAGDDEKTNTKNKVRVKALVNLKYNEKICPIDKVFFVEPDDVEDLKKRGLVEVRDKK